MSRGGREGNNALCKKDGPEPIDSQSLAEFTLAEPTTTVLIIEALIKNNVNTVFLYNRQLQMINFLKKQCN